MGNYTCTQNICESRGCQISLSVTFKILCILLVEVENNGANKDVSSAVGDEH